MSPRLSHGRKDTRTWGLVLDAEAASGVSFSWWDRRGGSRSGHLVTLSYPAPVPAVVIF